jgi:transposase
MPRKLRKTIKAVCAARSEGGVQAAQEVCGTRIQMVMDRLQVAQWSRKGLDTLRTPALHRLQRARPEAASQHRQGVMWALRKREDHRPDEDPALCARLVVQAPRVNVADELWKAFTGICEKRRGKRRAQSQRTDWRGRVRDSPWGCFNTFRTP